MRILFRKDDAFSVLVVEGDVDSLAAGELYDTLVQAIMEGRPGLIVDMSKVGSITRAGMRGLVVAAKMGKPREGKLKIRCGGNRKVEQALEDHGFSHLFDFVAGSGVSTHAAGEHRNIGSRGKILELQLPPAYDAPNRPATDRAVDTTPACHRQAI